MVLIPYLLIGKIIYTSIKGLFKSKLFWIVNLSIGIWFLSYFSIFGFFIRNEILDSGDEAISMAKARAESIRSIYDEAIQQEGEEPDNLLGNPVPDFNSVVPDFDNSTGGGGGSIGDSTSPVYDSTKDYAESISGTSVLHQLHNAIVSASNESPHSWFNYSFIIGINMKEANGFGGSWIPHIGADKRGLADPNFNLSTWGINDITDINDIDSIYNDKPYIGPFQTSWEYYNSSMGRPGHWGKDSWVTFVDGSKGNLDGNGDGKMDPFNYLDALKVLRYHSEAKLTATQPYWSFVSDQYRVDMEQMSIMTRYVGVSNSQGTKRYSSSDGPWTGYTHHENLNPHIQLMRKAAEEVYNNGPIFTEFRNFLVSSKSANGTGLQEIVNKLYNSNGWVATGTTNSGGSATYTFEDGKTMVLKGQNMHYTFIAYWAGKVAEQEISNILKGS